jgi:predicted RNA binding protein YcfA (HicA-like mRNA interferase family)
MHIYGLPVVSQGVKASCCVSRARGDDTPDDDMAIEHAHAADTPGCVCLRRCILPVDQVGSSAWESTPSVNLRYNCLMKVRDAIRLVEQDGWFLVATRGSHRQYKHPSKPGRVTIAGKPSDDLAPGTLNSILKQSGLKEQH